MIFNDRYIILANSKSQGQWFTVCKGNISFLMKSCWLSSPTSTFFCCLPFNWSRLIKIKGCGAWPFSSPEGGITEKSLRTTESSIHLLYKMSGSSAISISQRNNFHHLFRENSTQLWIKIYCWLKCNYSFIIIIIRYFYKQNMKCKCLQSSLDIAKRPSNFHQEGTASRV